MDDLCLDMWYIGHTADDIAEALDIHRDTVFARLRSARQRGDHRAARRQHQAPAMQRRYMIQTLVSTGWDKREVARKLRLSVRTIENHMQAEGV